MEDSYPRQKTNIYFNLVDCDSTVQGLTVTYNLLHRLCEGQTPLWRCVMSQRSWPAEGILTCTARCSIQWTKGSRNWEQHLEEAQSLQRMFVAQSCSTYHARSWPQDGRWRVPGYESIDLSHLRCSWWGICESKSTMQPILSLYLKSQPEGLRLVTCGSVRLSSLCREGSHSLPRLCIL